MKRHRIVKPNEQSGMTLVEVLASIVILTIILSIVFMVFIQTTKTTNKTDETISATYIGQTEMEQVYAGSIEKEYDEWQPADAFISKPAEDNWDVYERRPTIEKPFRIKLQLKEDDGMVRVLIKVYDEDEQDEGKPLVQMENYYNWKESDSQ